MPLRLPTPSGGNLGRTKNIIHFVQAFIIFIAWALTIAIWTKGDGIDSRTVWYWILCWASIPALIYLAAVPMWPRARRFGNVYAFAVVDALYALFWLTAWAAVANYVAQGKAMGSSSDTGTTKPSGSSGSSSSSAKFRRAGSSSSSNSGSSSGSSGSSGSSSACANWAYGNEAKCNLSTATTIIGVIIFLLFVLTAWMSWRNVMHFRRTGTLPDAVSDPTFAAQSKAAFSSNPAHDFEEEDDFRSGRAGGMAPSSRADRDEDYALLQQSEVDGPGNRTAMHGGYDPTAPQSGPMLHDYTSTTGYGGAHGQHSVPYTPSDYGGSMSGYGRV